MIGDDLIQPAQYGTTNYEDFLRADYIGIFLNLHKDCGNATVANPVTWRNPKLLSSGGLVISERCYGKDEIEFKGLIDFVERADIPIMFEQYVRMSPSERLRLGLSRREAFAKRFDAVRIFEQAGIGSLLRASSTARPADSHAPAAGRFVISMCFAARSRPLPLRATLVRVLPCGVSKPADLAPEPSSALASVFEL